MQYFAVAGLVLIDVWAALAPASPLNMHPLLTGLVIGVASLGVWLWSAAVNFILALTQLGATLG